MIRAATEPDVPSVARLHTSEIADGFLSSLGPRFLACLYRRIARHPGTVLLVADDHGEIVGFVAAAESTGALYRSFLARDALRVALASGPRLVGAARRVVETLRYPAVTDAGACAELLAVAVAPRARGHGLGGALVEAATNELARRGHTAVRVVTASGNEPAMALYQRCGFRPAGTLVLHRGTASEILERR